MLAAADLIAAEDTRRSGRLLRHFGIATPCQSLHEHNERDVTARLIERLQGGASVALISDAGTPLISDPGYPLVRAAHDAGLRLVPVPGPSALSAALSVSGLPTDHFVFEGFLPPKAARRRERLEQLRDETRTLVLFEAPHRVLAMIEALAEVFGSGREAAYMRELTKLHETVRRATLGDLQTWIRDDPQQQKGEIIVVVHGAKPAEASAETEAERVLEILLEELPLKRAVAVAAKLTGAGRNRLYELGLQRRESRH